jgi:predicted DNA-binding transcriptional regulator AlpA
MSQGVLIGVRSICAYTRIGPNTFYRWCRDHGFPATLTLGGRWITSKQLIDSWIVARWKAQRATQQSVREAVLAGSGSRRAGQ